MSQKIEGTVILDGLIQGKVPALPGAEQRLRDWVKFARDAHLHFNLEIAGGTFGYLADQTPLSAGDLGHDPAETVAAAIGEMLKIFPPAERSAVFSTLRSVEYRKAEEVQTLYVIRPDGTVLPRGRTVSAATSAPAAPPTARDRATRIVIGAVLLVLVLMVSSLFIDYRGMFANLRSQLRSLDAPHFPVDAAAFAAYFTIESKSPARGSQGLVLTLRRTPQFLLASGLPATLPSTAPSTLPAARAQAPATAASSAAGNTASANHAATLLPAPQDAPAMLPASIEPSSSASRLAKTAIATGYIRCEYFGEKGQYMGYVFLRIKPLRDDETMKLEIPFEGDHRPSSIVLTY